VIRRLCAGISVLIALAAFGAGVAHAGEASLEGEFVQGGLVEGVAPPGTRVLLNDAPVRVSPGGLFLLGFGREAAGEAVVAFEYPDGSREQRRLEIGQREYEIQRVDGLPPRMVTPPEEVLARIREEAAQIRRARARDTALTDFRDGFAWPALGRISGVYGSQRILNGEPRQPHYGLDIAAPVGTPVIAPAPGTVVLAEPDMYYSGGTLMIDHGHGLISAFLHLSRIDVAAGQRVRRGERIGAIGATGRVTGAHLDWRINWFEERLDPALLVGPMPTQQ
jgi:murein DD-endopeptidase MepM/ murein hydrolase activator NlpD